MVSVVTKKIKGKEYLYLVDSIRKGKKVLQKTIKYVGKKRPILKEEFECMKLSFHKKDWILNNFIDQLSYKDHHKMKKVSDDYKTYISNLDKVSKEKEKERFLSIFISNSNSIEGSTLTVDETFNYLFKDITPKGHPKKELFMASNLLKAWGYVEENYKRLPNENDLFKLHQMVNKEIESDKTLGKFKKVQNYVGGIHTTSYLFVEQKMKELFVWIKKSFKKIDNFEVAFQSHAQFEIIHPFVDGNGRVGRLIMNWFLMNRKLMYFAIPFKEKGDYILALDHARKGNLKSICSFCYKVYLENYKFI